MQDKEKTEKPIVLKKSDFTSKTVAEVAGYSESMVKKVRCGAKDGESEAVQKIKLADHLLYEGSTALLETVKKLLPL